MSARDWTPTPYASAGPQVIAAHQPRTDALTPEQRAFMRDNYAGLWVRVKREQSAEDVEWGAVEGAMGMDAWLNGDRFRFTEAAGGGAAQIVRLPKAMGNVSECRFRENRTIARNAGR